MKNAFIIGKQIYLRALEEEDLEGNYLKWLNDPEVTSYMTTGLFPQTKRMLKDFYDKICTDSSSVYFAIIDKESDKHIGNTKVDHIDWVNRRCEFGILIGEREFWGKGICAEVTKLIVEYVFTKLNLRKMRIDTIETNESAVKCYKSIGFKEEGRLKEMHHDHTQNKYVDFLIFGLLRRDYFKQLGKELPQDN